MTYTFYILALMLLLSYVLVLFSCGMLCCPFATYGPRQTKYHPYCVLVYGWIKP